MSIAGYEWKPIENLPANWEVLTRKDLHALAQNWKDHSVQLKQSAAYSMFMERLRRKIAIETGVIERLYTIDRGTTQLLIERGFDDALIPHSSTGQSAAQTIALIRDHEAAYEFIQDRRPLSTSYIKELHQLLTRNQPDVDAIDQFGKTVRRLLLHGDWKKEPNNPQRPNGEIHQYCPPLQTASQMDQLIEWHNQHLAQRIPAEIEAAWLHHRFTQIHPFQDGNGRVVRLLATLVFLREGWFPLVITRDERYNYIHALELADEGELKPLVDLFARLQAQEFDKALNLSEQTLNEAPLSIMLADYAETLRRQQLAKQEADRLHTESIANELAELAFTRFQSAEKEWQELISPVMRSLRVAAKQSNSDNLTYYRYQITETAKQLHYFANRAIYNKWVHLKITTGSKIPTGFLLSFHGFGQEYRGVLVCSACAYQNLEGDDKSSNIQYIEPLSLDPFRITVNEDKSEMKARFQNWLEDILGAGFAYWANERA